MLVINFKRKRKLSDVVIKLKNNWNIIKDLVKMNKKICNKYTITF
jgi:hypothetical protein